MPWAQCELREFVGEEAAYQDPAIAKRGESSRNLPQDGYLETLVREARSLAAGKELDEVLERHWRRHSACRSCLD